MALLPRCAYLLGTARAAGAVDPLLSILIRRVGWAAWARSSVGARVGRQPLSKHVAGGGTCGSSC